MMRAAVGAAVAGGLFAWWSWQRGRYLREVAELDYWVAMSRVYARADTDNLMAGRRGSELPSFEAWRARYPYPGR